MCLIDTYQCIYMYMYIHIYQMDCVCQRYHKECSTRTCADDCYNCTYELSLDFFQQLYTYIYIYIYWSIHQTQSWIVIIETSLNSIVWNIQYRLSIYCKLLCNLLLSLQWRYTGRDGVSNQQPHHCLLNRLFRHRSKKTSKPRVTGLGAGNSPVTGEFPAQIASNAENVSFWWRYQDATMIFLTEDTINATLAILQRSFSITKTMISVWRGDHFLCLM